MKCNEAALLLLTDTYSPGWRCYVAGEAAPIRRANRPHRAVEVLAREHVVELRSCPAGLKTGACVFVIGILALLLDGGCRLVTGRRCGAPPNKGAGNPKREVVIAGIAAAAGPDGTGRKEEKGFYGGVDQYKPAQTGRGGLAEDIHGDARTVRICVGPTAPPCSQGSCGRLLLRQPSGSLAGMHRTGVPAGRRRDSGARRGTGRQ